MISFQMICQQRAKNLFFFKLRELNLLYNDAKKIYRLIGGDGSSNILVIPWPWCPKSFLFGASGKDNFIWEAWISKYGKWDFAKILPIKSEKNWKRRRSSFWQNFFNTFGFMSCVCADFSEYILQYIVYKNYIYHNKVMKIVVGNEYFAWWHKYLKIMNQHL